MKRVVGRLYIWWLRAEGAVLQATVRKRRAENKLIGEWARLYRDTGTLDWIPNQLVVALVEMAVPAK